MSAVGMSVVLLSTLAFFSWSVFRRYRQMLIGVPDPRFAWSPAQVVARTKDVVMLALGQQKMWSKKGYLASGLAHIGIFAAFNALLLNSILLWGRGYDYDWGFFFNLLDTNTLTGQVYSLVKELSAAAAMVGCVVFWQIRIAKRGVDSGDPQAVGDRPRMTLGFEPNLILFIIFTMMAADFLYVGAHLALDAQANGTGVDFAIYEPFGSVFGLALQNLPYEFVTYAEHIGFWWHASWVLLFLNLLPFSKHFHVLTVMPSVFARDPRPNALPPIVDLEGRVERDEPIGINTISDLTYGHILDLYTCTECGRCSDNCPAYITDKKLSPKHLTLALRDHLYGSESAHFGATDDVVGSAAPSAATAASPVPLKTHPAAPDGGYFLSVDADTEIVPSILHPDVIWSCTTCRACEEQCPVMISYVDKIVGMRREITMLKADHPPLLESAYQGIQTNGNPWNYSAMDRADWAKDLDVPTLSDRPDASVLYWVGCAAAYDERAQKIARATAQLLTRAGVDFAILGTDETCTGDPARRGGNEFLFQMMAEQNIELLNEAGVEKKTIVTACPHCFNTLANEYPDFGGHYDVVHHADFLNGLLVAGKLVPTHRVSGSVVYHDSCYLGRYNQIYDSPRQILESIDGLTITEVPYWNKQQGLCCGAGGSQYFMEETGGDKVNDKRTLQLLDTGANMIASACPFCMGMVSLGLKNADKEESIRQRDIAEVLAEAVGIH